MAVLLVAGCSGGTGNTDTADTPGQDTTEDVADDAASAGGTAQVLMMGRSVMGGWFESWGWDWESPVNKDGFELDGQMFGSLSEAARAVTGQRWNGPLFWGVTQRKRRT